MLDLSSPLRSTQGRSDGIAAVLRRVAKRIQECKTTGERSIVSSAACRVGPGFHRRFHESTESNERPKLAVIAMEMVAIHRRGLQKHFAATEWREIYQVEIVAPG